ncbi:unnamed protein product [Urochloa humidicola]
MALACCDGGGVSGRRRHPSAAARRADKTGSAAALGAHGLLGCGASLVGRRWPGSSGGVGQLGVGRRGRPDLDGGGVERRKRPDLSLSTGGGGGQRAPDGGMQ